MALLGPNGAGKTTLTKAVAGMLPFELGMTVVVAEQTVPRLLKLATDVYVLSRGRVTMHARPDEADEEALQRLYLS